MLYSQQWERMFVNQEARIKVRTLLVCVWNRLGEFNEKIGRETMVMLSQDGLGAFCLIISWQM